MNTRVAVKRQQRRQCFNMLEQTRGIKTFKVQSPKDPRCVTFWPCSIAFILLLSGVKIGQR